MSTSIEAGAAGKAAKAAARKAARDRNRLEAIRRFDALPDSAGVRLPVVSAVTGYSFASVWRHSKPGGLLPAPVRVGPKNTVWIVGALRATLKRIASTSP